MQLGEIAVNIPINSGYTNAPVNTGYESKQAVPTTQVGTGTSNSNEREFIDAIEKANNIKTGSTECQFSIHEKTKKVLIKLVDSNTKEVIKEIPSEKILDAFTTMCETAGLFVDHKG